MTNLDNELAEDYLAETREHLADIEADLLAIEKGGAEIDEDLVNRAFRAVHSVKGGASYFELLKVRDLAHQVETVLACVRSRRLVPTPERIRLLLSATDTLRELIQDPETSNQADIAAIMGDLAALSEHRRGARTAVMSTRRPATPGRRARSARFWWKTTSPAGSCSRSSSPAMANATSR